MFFRPVSVRKFLFNNTDYNDFVNWSVIRDGDPEWGNVELNFEISDGNRTYCISTQKPFGKAYSRKYNGPKNVAEALKPINELIDALSKASITFAKACNMPTVEVKEEKKDKPNKEKQAKPKKVTMENMAGINKRKKEGGKSHEI